MSKSSISNNIVTFKKRTNQLTEVVFKFNREIIDVIKTIPDFFYENKKWFIPMDKKAQLQEKIELLQALKDTDEKIIESKIVKRKLDFDENIQPKKTSKFFHSINVQYTTDHDLSIILPVSKFVFAKLMNCADLVILKESKKWKIVGSDNVKKFNECCDSYNIHVNGEMCQIKTMTSKQNPIISKDKDDDIIFLDKFGGDNAVFKIEPNEVDEIQDSQIIF